MLRPPYTCRTGSIGGLPGSPGLRSFHKGFIGTRCMQAEVPSCNALDADKSLVQRIRSRRSDPMRNRNTPDIATFHPIPQPDVPESGEKCRYRISVWGPLQRTLAQLMHLCITPTPTEFYGYHTKLHKWPFALAIEVNTQGFKQQNP